MKYGNNKNMSRIGKKPILIQQGVDVIIDENQVAVKGPKGELKKVLRPEIVIEKKEDKIYVYPKVENKKNKAFWGLTASLIFNMIHGVSQGYEKKLQIEGVGYRAEVKDNLVILRVGFSHVVEFKIPEGIEISVERNIVTIKGIDKEIVGLTAAKIRDIRPPEPYKGKGIRYVGEIVRRKAGKKAVSSS